MRLRHALRPMPWNTRAVIALLVSALLLWTLLAIVV
jgi:hypothetical protein